MKHTLRQGIEIILSRMDFRIKMLDNNIKEYQKSENWEAAMKCDIKMKTLKMVYDDLQKTLLL